MIESEHTQPAEEPAGAATEPVAVPDATEPVPAADPASATESVPDATEPVPAAEPVAAPELIPAPEAGVATEAAPDEPTGAAGPAPGPAPPPEAEARAESPPTASPKRRRRPTAAERHRRVFFARLNELRVSGRDAAGEVSEAAEAAETPPASSLPEAIVETGETELAQAAGAEATDAAGAATEAEVSSAIEPDAAADSEVAADSPSDAAADEEPPAADAGPEAGAQTTSSEPDAVHTAATARDRGPRERAPRTAREQARLVAVIERVGGHEVIRAALQPKRDEAGKPLKWAAVCCEAARGLKPGDPVFAAWVRLAGTPVREIKTRIPDDRPARGGRDGGGRGGPESGRGSRDGGGRGNPEGARRDRDGRRGGRSGRASREDMARHAYGGRVGAKIVIPGFEAPPAEGPAPPADAGEEHG